VPKLLCKCGKVSCGDLLHDFDLEVALCDELLQAVVLGLESLQSLRIGGFHGAETLAPGVDGLLADLVLLGDLRDGPPIGFAKDRDHLLVGCIGSCASGSPGVAGKASSHASAGPKNPGRSLTTSWSSMTSHRSIRRPLGNVRPGIKRTVAHRPPLRPSAAIASCLDPKPFPSGRAGSHNRLDGLLASPERR
jgi:hypothetical protein